MSSLENALAERMSVEDTITRLFVNLDDGNKNELPGFFAETVLLDFGSAIHADSPARLGASGVVDLWFSILDEYRSTHHQIGNFLVEIEDTTASAFCYCFAALEYDSAQRGIRLEFGTFELGLSKEDDGWRIRAMRYRAKSVTPMKDAPKARQPEQGVTKGKRRSRRPKSPGL